MVFAAVGNDYICARRRGIHNAFGIYSAVGALIYIIEYNRRRNFAGYICAVKHKSNHRGRICHGILAKVNRKLAFAQRAADAVNACLCDGDKGVRGSLGFGVLVLVVAVAVFVAALVIIHIVVVNNFAAHSNAVNFLARGNGFAVHGYAVVGKHDLLCVGIFGLCAALAAAAAFTLGITALLSIASGKSRKAKR